MGSQQELHDILKVFTDAVYFQTPPNTGMAYPAIVYKWDDADTKFADNRPYRFLKRYMVTVIDRSPLSVIPDQVATLPTCVFDRTYVANNLNHTVFLLYF
jgi:hypothetical protein